MILVWVMIEVAAMVFFWLGLSNGTPYYIVIALLVIQLVAAGHLEVKTKRSKKRD